MIVQHIQRKLYLRNDGQWVNSRTEAKQFTTAPEAISFCIRTRSQEARLLGKGANGDDVHLYPFGGDPAVRLELRKLRKSIRESRRLKAERRVIRARIDMLMAGGKETKKQFPFPSRANRKRDPEPNADRNSDILIDTGSAAGEHNQS